MRFLIELLITLAGSGAVWFALGTPLYALAAIVMALFVLGLALTARARASTNNLVIETDATPLGLRIFIAIAAPILVGTFWPVLPTVIAWKRVRARPTLVTVIDDGYQLDRDNSGRP